MTDQVAHTTIGSAKTHRRSKDKDDTPIGGSWAQKMRKPDADRASQDALWRAYRKPEPRPSEFGIFMDPTRSGWRHGT